MLKPDVVFFGEFVPVERFAEARAMVVGADALLDRRVVARGQLAASGCSRQATRRKLPVVIVNRGVTKGDSRATVKLDAGTSETLTALAERLVDA